VEAFLREVIPKPPDPSTRSEVFARVLPYQDELREGRNYRGDDMADAVR
jgi:hypothetical protein